MDKVLSQILEIDKRNRETVETARQKEATQSQSLQREKASLEQVEQKQADERITAMKQKLEAEAEQQFSRAAAESETELRRLEAFFNANQETLAQTLFLRSIGREGDG